MTFKLDNRRPFPRCPENDSSWPVADLGYLNVMAFGENTVAPYGVCETQYEDTKWCPEKH